MDSSLQTIAGWLHKKGDKGITKTWARRWFQFLRGNIVYATEPGTLNKPNGQIELSKVTGVTLNDSLVAQSGKQGRGFEITTNFGRIYYLIADNDAELNKWVTFIREYVTGAKPQAPKPPQTPSGPPARPEQATGPPPRPVSVVLPNDPLEDSKLKTLLQEKEELQARLRQAEETSANKDEVFLELFKLLGDQICEFSKDISGEPPQFPSKPIKNPQELQLIREGAKGVTTRLQLKIAKLKEEEEAKKEANDRYERSIDDLRAAKSQVEEELRSTELRTQATSPIQHNDQLEQELSRLQLQTEEAVRGKAEAEASNARLNHSLKETEERLNQRYEEAHRRSELLEIQLNESKSQGTTQQGKITLLEARLKEFENNLGDREAQLNQLVTNLESKVTSLEHQNRECSKLAEDRSVELQAMRNRFSELQEQLNTTNDEQQKQQTQHHSELESLRAKHQEREKELQAKVDVLQRELEASTHSKSQLKGELSHWMQATEQMQSKNVELETTIQQLLSDKETLQSKNQLQESEVISVNKRLSELQVEYQKQAELNSKSATEQNDELQGLLRSAHQKNSELQNETQEQKATLHQKIEAQQKENSQLSQTLIEKEAQITHQRNSFEKDLQTLRSDMQQALSVASELKTQNVTLQQQNQALKERHKDQESKFQQELANVQQDLKSAQFSLEQALQHKEEASRLQQESVERQQELQRAQMSLEQNHTLKEQHKEQVSKLQQELANVQQDLKSAQFSLEQQKQALQEHPASSQSSQDSNREAEITDLKKANQALHAQIKLLKDQELDNADAFAEYEQVVAQLKHQLSESINDSNKSQPKLQKSDQKDDDNGAAEPLNINEVWTRNVELEKSMVQIQAQIRALEEESDIHRSKHLVQADQIDSMRKEIESKDAQLFQLKQSFRDLRQKSGDLPAVSRDEQLQSMNQMIAAHQSQCSFLTRTLQRIEQEKKDLIGIHKKMETLTVQQAGYWHTRYIELWKKVLVQEQAISSELLVEFEDLKQKFFHSLAIGIKLSFSQQGTPVSLDIGLLYEMAKKLDWKEWPSWLEQTFQKTQKEEANRRVQVSLHGQKMSGGW